jgi:hypothetical protein
MTAVSKRLGQHYQPTPQEIREACAQIQAEWSDEERDKRAIGPTHSARIPTVRARFLQDPGGGAWMLDLMDSDE